MVFAQFKAKARACRPLNAQHLLKATAVALALLASANAGAAGLLEKMLAPAVGIKPGFSEGKKVYTEDTLKPDELMGCVIKAKSIDSRGSSQSPEEVAALEKERASLQEEAKVLIAAIEKTKETPLSPDEADKLNKRKDDYTARQQAWNAKANGANAEAQAKNKALNAELNDFRENCAGRPFFKSDLEAVRPKLPFDISDILAGKK